MTDRWMLNPTYIDGPCEGLRTALGSDWLVNGPPEAAGGSPTERIAEFLVPVADWVSRTVRAGDRPVLVAGDCLSSLGVLAGLQREGVDPTLVWLDAHGDFNTWDTTPSGFLGGMPLAMAVGRGEQTIPRRLGLAPWRQDRVVVSDARDLDPGEAEALSRSSIAVVTKLEGLPAALPDRGPLYVHVDVDVVDPQDLPAVNYPARGGPSAAATADVLAALARTGRVIAASLSAWEPTLDPSGEGRRLSLGLLDGLVGR